MYKGEVNVGQSCLPTFLKTAESLQVNELNFNNRYSIADLSYFYFIQVRGLTDNNNINYRPECDKERSSESSTGGGGGGGGGTGGSGGSSGGGGAGGGGGAAAAADNKSSIGLTAKTHREFERDIERERDGRDRSDMERDRDLLLDRDRDRDLLRDRRSAISGGGSMVCGVGILGGSSSSIGGGGGTGGDEQSILDLKDFKERERDRELSTTPVDHHISKRRRKNSSSNCDNSLTSTHSANVQERNYSQDSQVSFFDICMLT